MSVADTRKDKKEKKKKTPGPRTVQYPIDEVGIEKPHYFQISLFQFYLPYIIIVIKYDIRYDTKNTGQVADD